jgi:hypothetical protein
MSPTVGRPRQYREAIVVGMARTTSPQVRKLLLTAHIVASVALLGHLLGVIAIGLAIDNDPTLGQAPIVHWYQGALTRTFGASLSMISLLTGIALGLITKWGVFRHGWVVAKIVLLVVTVAIGIALPPWTWTAMIQWTAMLAATVLSVYKPRRRRGTSAPRRATGSVAAVA